MWGKQKEKSLKTHQGYKGGWQWKNTTKKREREKKKKKLKLGSHTLLGSCL